MKAVKINLNMTFEGLDGKPLPDVDGTPATARTALRTALANEFQEDTAHGSAEAVKTKLTRYDLSQDIKEAESEIVLSLDQAEMLEKRVALSFAIQVAGPIIRALRKQVDMAPVHESVDNAS